MTEPSALSSTTHPTATAPPESCGVAFKEWFGVCRALGDGRQSLILRKGGVEEVGGEFRPEHPAFWLYPTLVHQAEQGLRTPEPPDPSARFDPATLVPIETLAVVEWAGRVDDLTQLAALEPWHDWTEATIRGRFDYRRPGLWALVVRVFRRAEPWPLPVTPAQLGCRTWVPLDPSIPLDGARAVLSEPEATERLAAIRRALGDRPDR